MSRLSLAACAVALLLAPAAEAADAPANPAFDACAAKAHGATFPLLHCYAQDMEARETAMTAALNAALAAATDPRTKQFIQTSQTAWSDYRDAWCEARVPRSGSLARLKLMSCRVAETARRTDELRALAR